MAQMAASTSLFRKELDKSGRDVDMFVRQTQTAEKSIDKFSGRLSLLGNVAAVLGPSLVPIGAVAVPAVAGLASELGFAALGAGVAVLAFQGMGDALKAMNKAGLDPTKENLEAARQAMNAISPDAQKFVNTLRDLQPELKKTQALAAEGMLPGLADGLDALVTRMPDVQRIVSAVAGELGDIGGSVGSSLASARWDDFFTFLATDAPSALHDMAEAAGNTGHAMAEMWMAFDPLNDDFSSVLVKATESLDQWATGLSKTAGFQEFMDYIEATGPQVASTLGALGSALLQIVEAAAPIGGPILAGIEAFAKAVSAIADSDLGTPIFGALAALSALNLTMRASAAISKTTFGGPIVGAMQRQSTGLKTLRADWAAYNAVTRTAQGRAQSTGAGMIASRAAAERLGGTLRQTGAAVGKTGALIGGLAIATSGAADGIGLTNTASLALMGTMVGGGLGAAIGGTIGATIDLTHANDGLNDSMTQLNAIAGKVDFATFNRALDDAQKKIDDLSHSDGFKDFVSDTLKGTAATLQGRGLTKGQISKSYQKDVSAAESAQMQAGRARGAAAATAAAAANSALAAKGFKLVGSAAAAAGQSVDGFTASIEGANAALKRDGSIDAYKSSLLDAADAIKENGKGLHGMTREAIDNRTKLRGIASGALEAAQGMKSFERRSLFLDRARNSFIRLAQAAGASGPAARKMANDYGLVDRVTRNSAESVSGLNKQIRGLKGKIVDAKAKGAKESSPQVQALRAEIARLKGKSVEIKAKTAAAIAAANATQAAINRIHGKTVDVIVRRRSAGVPIQDASARGNIFYYAQGDVANRHMPELAGPGPTRVWREPETQGEAYIPLANDDRRPRARAIAEETVGLLGGDVEWYARGGHKGGHKKPESPRHKFLRNVLDDFEDALKASTKAIDAETSARDNVVSKRNDLRSTVSGAFTSDPFAGGDVWQAGGGDPLGILKADIAKADAFKAVLASLAKAGLDGDAMAAIASTGDIGKAQALAAGGKAGVGQFETLFNQRAAAATSVGNYAGAAAYQAQINAQNAHLRAQLIVQRALNLKIDRIEKALNAHPAKTGKAVAHGVNKGAAAAKRKKR
jgi:hypothetical protein